MFKVREVTSVNYYFCRSKKVKDFLTSKGIQPIGEQPQEKCPQFKIWLFIRNRELSEALTEYSQIKLEYFKRLEV